MYIRNCNQLQENDCVTKKFLPGWKDFVTLYIHLKKMFVTYIPSYTENINRIVNL